jgi:hypothetical protein
VFTKITSAERWFDAVDIKQMKAKCSTHARRFATVIKLTTMGIIEENVSAERKVIAPGIFKVRIPCERPTKELIVCFDEFLNAGHKMKLS